MSQVRIDVQKCIQGSQEYGSTDDHMVSRVFFSVHVDGVPKCQDFCDIKQIVGSSYSSGNMEVSRPHQYRGPYDHRIFSDEMAGYYSKLVDSSGPIISLGSAQKVRMMHNTFAVLYEFTFEAEEAGASW